MGVILTTDDRIVAVLLKLAEVAQVNRVTTDFLGLRTAAELGVWPSEFELEVARDVAS